MAITVARGVASRMRGEYPGILIIQVQGASDPDTAAAALDEAREEIWKLEPNYVAEAMPAATGPFLWVDCPSVPARLRETIPDIVARHLQAAGVADAVITAPKGEGPLAALETLPRAVVLRLYPPPPPVERLQRQRSHIPAEWLDPACAWFRGDIEDDHEVMGAVGVMEFPLAAAEATRFLHQCREARPLTSLLVAGSIETKLRGINGCFASPAPNLALAAGGPGATDDDLLAAIEVFQDLARSFASHLAYAFIIIPPSFASFRASSPATEWVGLGGEAPGPDLDMLCDQYAFDGFMWQILGPGHLRRLGGAPDGTRPLPGGRVELTIGEPSAWLLRDSRPVPTQSYDPWQGLSARRKDPHISKIARDVLAPCLLRQGEAVALAIASTTR